MTWWLWLALLVGIAWTSGRIGYEIGRYRANRWWTDMVYKSGLEALRQDIERKMKQDVRE